LIWLIHFAKNVQMFDLTVKSTIFTDSTTLLDGWYIDF